VNVLEDLTQQKFQEILIRAYLKGQENKKINAKELIEDIKKQVLTHK
jgi:hypothetical protein